MANSSYRYAKKSLRQSNVRLLLVDSSLFYNFVRLLECQTLHDSDDGDLIMNQWRSQARAIPLDKNKFKSSLIYFND